jgi:hypothetical protein
VAVLLGILAHHRQPTSALVTHTVLRLPVLHSLSATGRLVDQKMNGWKIKITLAHRRFLVPIPPSPNPPTQPNICPYSAPRHEYQTREPWSGCTLSSMYPAHRCILLGSFPHPTVVPAAFCTKRLERTSFLFPFACCLSFRLRPTSF